MNLSLYLFAKGADEVRVAKLALCGPSLCLGFAAFYLPSDPIGPDDASAFGRDVINILSWEAGYFRIERAGP